MRLAKTKPVKKSKPKKRSPKTPLEQFHAYWEQIEKLEKKLARQQDEKEQFLARFEQEIRPLEEAQCRIIYQRTARLVTFFGRKSLTQWQREVLADWIEEELQFLQSHPFRGELDLTDLYQQMHQITLGRVSEDEITEQLGELREKLQEEFGVELHISDEALRTCLDDPERLLEIMARLVAEQQDAGTSDDNPEPGDDEANAWGGGHGEGDDSDAEAAPGQDDELDRLSSLIGKSTLKVLYRKLALALHPDRIRDTKQQQERAALMVSLTQAWEQKDMFALLTMAHTHLPANEQFLSKDNLAAINPLLARKIQDMQLELHNDRDNGLASLVYRKFKCRSKKATEQEFADHLDYLQCDISQTDAWLATVTSLKALKPYLEARWERQQFGQFDDLTFIFG